jgi:hypothetical protein
MAFEASGPICLKKFGNALKQEYDTHMATQNATPYNPPGVEGTEASMLEHVFQCHGVRLSPSMVWPTTPRTESRWRPFPMKPWQKTPRSRVAQSHKSYGD